MRSSEQLPRLTTSPSRSRPFAKSNSKNRASIIAKDQSTSRLPLCLGPVPSPAEPSKKPSSTLASKSISNSSNSPPASPDPRSSQARARLIRFPSKKPSKTHRKASKTLQKLRKTLQKPLGNSRSRTPLTAPFPLPLTPPNFANHKLSKKIISLLFIHFPYFFRKPRSPRFTLCSWKPLSKQRPRSAAKPRLHAKFRPYGQIK